MTGVLPALRVRPGRWELQTTLSCAQLRVHHLGLASVRGTVPIREATARVGLDGRPASVRAVLELDRLDTGNVRRDADLRKPHLLDTGRNPLLRFAGDSIEPEQGGWLVSGTLEACGHTVPLTLVASMVDAHDDMLSVVARARVDRRALGVRAPRVLIGSWVDVTIHATFAAA